MIAYLSKKDAEARAGQPDPGEEFMKFINSLEAEKKQA